eukprot:15049033-Ditylum_brightwellii.AAC.1
MSATVTHYAFTVLRSRVVTHYQYGEYCLLTRTFGKNNKTSQKEATDEETGLCPAQQEMEKNIRLPTLFKS